jgi:hypothetical protein
MNLFLQSFVLSSFALLSIGCVDSPLLHHANAPGEHDAVGGGRLTEACPLSFAKFGACAAIDWTKTPTQTEKGAFRISFWNAKTGSASGPFFDPGKTVFVKLWMPDMGHGSSPVKVSPAVDAAGAPIPGLYDATDVYFVMGGAWEIWVQLREGVEVLDEAKLDLSIE